VSSSSSAASLTYFYTLPIAVLIPVNTTIPSAYPYVTIVDEKIIFL
jgi:hypothetical protein